MLPKLFDRYEARTLEAFFNLCRIIGISPLIKAMTLGLPFQGPEGHWLRTVIIDLDYGQKIKQNWVFGFKEEKGEEPEIAEIVIKFRTNDWERFLKFKVCRSQGSTALVFIPEGEDPKTFLCLSPQSQERAVRVYWRNSAITGM